METQEQQQEAIVEEKVDVEPVRFINCRKCMQSELRYQLEVGFSTTGIVVRCKMHGHVIHFTADEIHALVEHTPDCECCKDKPNEYLAGRVRELADAEGAQMIIDLQRAMEIKEPLGDALEGWKAMTLGEKIKTIEAHDYFFRVGPGAPKDEDNG